MKNRFLTLSASLLLLMVFDPCTSGQTGTGWTEYFPERRIHLAQEDKLRTFDWAPAIAYGTPPCASYEYDSLTLTETFRLFGMRSNRSEIRLFNDYGVGARQFEGYVTFYPPLDNESLMQVWGSDEGATQLMIRGYSANGGEIGISNAVIPGTPRVATNCYNREIKINVIHYQEDMGNRFEVYIDDKKVLEFADNEMPKNNNGKNYHKYGCYGTVKPGHESPVVKWRNVRHFKIESKLASRHYLPKTDRQYEYTSGYVENDPVPEYNWASEKAYEDFRDIKYGIRIHWGLYSIIRQEKESWPLLKLPYEKKQDYFDMYKSWNPVGFSADEWMNLFAESGLKMFAFTSKHHEGFSMFDTKTRVTRRVNWTAPGGPVIEDCDLAFSIMETPFRRDVVKELCDAARQKGIKIDLYFSHPDWYDADFRPYVWHPLQVPSSGRLAVKGKNLEPEGGIESHFGTVAPVIVPDPTPEETARMIKRHREQLTELLTNYGKIDMLCLDMWLGPSVWPELRETILQLRKIQPDVMLRARGIGNYGDYYTPEGFVPGNKENTSVPWFVIYPLGRTFSYESEASQYKGAKWIIQNLIDCAAKGGNFMVGLGPDENGKFNDTAVEQLLQAGKWLKKNGSSIYATRAREAELWKEGENIRFTRSKDNKVIFVHCLEWPVNEVIIKTIKPSEDSKITLLGSGAELEWKYSKEAGLVIYTKPEYLASIPENERLAFTFRIEVSQ